MVGILVCLRRKFDPGLQFSFHLHHIRAWDADDSGVRNLMRHYLHPETKSSHLAEHRAVDWEIAAQLSAHLVEMDRRNRDHLSSEYIPDRLQPTARRSAGDGGWS